MEKTLFIINPLSGFKKTKRRLKNIVKAIHLFDHQARIVLTKYPLHATSFAKDALLMGVERLVVIGGDGTLNEVVNGFFDENGKALNPNASIGIVPSGTGTDFMRTIDHRKTLTKSIDFAKNGQSKSTDVGLVKAFDQYNNKVQRYFINVSSVGLSGLVARFMSRIKNVFGSRLSYFLAALKAIGTLEPQTITIGNDFQKKIINNCSLVSFANGKYFGSGMKIAPNAILDDGLFDVVAISDLKVMFFLLHAVKVYKGTHLSLDEVQTMQLSECTVESQNKGPIYVETDGELFAQLPARYFIKPKALMVVR